MKRTFNPSSVRRPFGNYNHGLLVPPGASLLVTSGQLGVGLDDRIPSDVTAQAEMCFKAIGAILEEAGMSFADVIRIGFSRLYGRARSLRPRSRAGLHTADRWRIYPRRISG